MNEQDLMQSMEHGQLTMSALVAECDLTYESPEVKLAEQLSKKILDDCIRFIEDHGLTQGMNIGPEGAKVILLGLSSAAIAASLVARISKEAGSQEQAEKLMRFAQQMHASMKEQP